MLDIYIDADGCPVKEEIYKIARGNAITMLDLPETIPGKMSGVAQPVGATR